LALDDESLKAALHTHGLTNSDKLLFVLLSFDGQPRAVKDVRAKTVSYGIRAAKDWNISRLLGASNGRAILVTNGWELTASGREHLQKLGIIGDNILIKQAQTLRKLLPKIQNERNRNFISEAVSCFEQRSLRAAAVLSWVGTISILYDYVLLNALDDFSNEWVRRNVRNKPIKTLDNLSDLKEDTFLDILHEISIIGKSVKDELKGCLKFRNGCGHPNTLEVGEMRVAGHLETQINNVYEKF
jgi:hypothetical protein